MSTIDVQSELRAWVDETQRDEFARRHPNHEDALDAALDEFEAAGRTATRDRSDLIILAGKFARRAEQEDSINAKLEPMTAEQFESMFADDFAAVFAAQLRPEVERIRAALFPRRDPTQPPLDLDSAHAWMQAELPKSSLSDDDYFKFLAAVDRSVEALKESADSLDLAGYSPPEPHAFDVVFLSTSDGNSKAYSAGMRDCTLTRLLAECEWLAESFDLTTSQVVAHVLTGQPIVYQKISAGYRPPSDRVPRLREWTITIRGAQINRELVYRGFREILRMESAYRAYRESTGRSYGDLTEPNLGLIREILELGGVPQAGKGRLAFWNSIGAVCETTPDAARMMYQRLVKRAPWVERLCSEN